MPLPKAAREAPRGYPDVHRLVEKAARRAGLACRVTSHTFRRGMRGGNGKWGNGGGVVMSEYRLERARSHARVRARA